MVKPPGNDLIDWLEAHTPTDQKLSKKVDSFIESIFFKYEE